MKELQSIFHILRSTTEPAVLASLLQVQGSSYRRVGARLLWNPAIPRVGSISGGCLEEDLIERAKAVLASGRSHTVVYDTTRENDLVWGVGLGCHGIVHVLLERVVGLPPHWETVASAWENRKAAVLASVYGEDHDDDTGTLLAVDSTEYVRSETEEAEQLAKRALFERCSAYHPQHHGKPGVTLFCEYLPPPLHLRVYGAGDDAIPLVRMAAELGWRVTVIDPRASFATASRFPQASQVLAERPEAAAAHSMDDWSVAVVMTHHYRFDLPLLRVLLPQRLRYLGVLGPKRRADQILTELAAEGFTPTPEMLEKMRAPVGLDLGSGSPEQVALAIVAEIQAVMNARDGRPLRERTRPIHG